MIDNTIHFEDAVAICIEHGVVIEDFFDDHPDQAGDDLAGNNINAAVLLAWLNR